MNIGNWQSFSIVSIVKLFHRHNDNEGLKLVKIKPIPATHCREYFGDLFTEDFPLSGELKRDPPTT